VTIDERGIIQPVNPATERMFGYAATELIGQNVKIFMPSEIADAHDGDLSAYARGGPAKIIGIGWIRTIVAACAKWTSARFLSAQA
jgi:PAS domain S-box-containing protein